MRKYGANIAAQKGAIAYLIRSVATGDDRHPHTGSLYYQDNIKKIPAAAISVPDANILDYRLSKGGSVDLYLNLQSHFGKTVQSANVIADITGAQQPNEIILLAAHLDSWDIGTGALDDASGVAIVSHAANLVSKIKRPKRTVRVVLFAAEEIGQLGAKAYVKKRGDILVDHLIGIEADAGAGQPLSLSTGNKAESLALLASIPKALAQIGIVPGSNKAKGGSDLRPFYAQKMPVAHIDQDLTGYFDVHHSASDTLEQVNPQSLNKNVAAYAIFTYLSANE